MVSKLTAEFCDPVQKRKFEDNMAFNKRKAGQSLKDFKQDIIKDMNRYSSIPAKIMVGGAQVDNPQKERQEVKRFKAGLRDLEGKKDRAYSKHMRYHLMEDADLTWKLAMYYASRWEGADSDIDDSDDSDESDDDVKAVEVDSAHVKPTDKTVSFARDGISISTLTDQVFKNQERIANLEAAQEHLEEAFKGIKTSQDAMNNTINNIAAKIDAMFAQGSQTEQYVEEYHGDGGGASAW